MIVIDLGVQDASICPDCLWCRASVKLDAQTYRQLCRCEEDQLAGPAVRWPRYDFNRCIDLCSCCGFEPIRTGSRWSGFFCDECKDRVMKVNRMRGAWVIPIGRHSIMHGASIRNADHEQVGAFVAALRGLGELIASLEEHKASAVRGNLMILGLLPANGPIDLRGYVESGRSFPLDKDEAAERLCEHLGATC